jgi:hypothetical protein
LREVESAPARGEDRTTSPDPTACASPSAASKTVTTASNAASGTELSPAGTWAVEFAVKSTNARPAKAIICNRPIRSCFFIDSFFCGQMPCLAG